MRGAAWVPADLHSHVATDKHRVRVDGSLRTSDYARLVEGNRGNAFEPLFADAYKKATNRPRLILTSRDAEPLQLPGCFQKLRILPFFDDQLRSFFQRWFSRKPESAQSVI